MLYSRDNDNNSVNLKDGFGRVVGDLRISVTERCNFKCVYCLPDGDHVHGKKSDLLTFEEIERLTAIFVKFGINKIRITGGEPLIRRDLHILISKIHRIDESLDIAITTNGYFLKEQIKDLASAGLKRVNLSIDTLNAAKFVLLTGMNSLDRVLRSLKAVEDAGISQIKFNAVVIRGYNDDEIIDLADFARQTGHVMRFIEFMPLDEGRSWSRDSVVPADEIYNKINGHKKLIPVAANSDSETAKRYSFEDGIGEIGIIASVTKPFCGSCNRIRLTADGKIRTCLFSHSEQDLKPLIRDNASDGEIMEFLKSAIKLKEWGHKINDPEFVQPERSMSYIGG